MSNEHNDDFDPDLAIQAARLLVNLRQIRAENERLHERVKELERQLADAYACIAVVVGPKQGGITVNPFDPITYTTCGPIDSGTIGATGGTWYPDSILQSPDTEDTSTPATSTAK